MGLLALAAGAGLAGGAQAAGTQLSQDIENQAKSNLMMQQINAQQQAAMRLEEFKSNLMLGQQAKERATLAASRNSAITQPGGILDQGVAQNFSGTDQAIASLQSGASGGTPLTQDQLDQVNAAKSDWKQGALANPQEYAKMASQADIQSGYLDPATLARTQAEIQASKNRWDSMVQSATIRGDTSAANNATTNATKLQIAAERTQEYAAKQANLSQPDKATMAQADTYRQQANSLETHEIPRLMALLQNTPTKQQGPIQDQIAASKAAAIQARQTALQIYGKASIDVKEAMRLRSLSVRANGDAGIPANPSDDPFQTDNLTGSSGARAASRGINPIDAAAQFKSLLGGAPTGPGQ